MGRRRREVAFGCRISVRFMTLQMQDTKKEGLSCNFGLSGKMMLQLRIQQHA
jgi:hypothetical protein